MKTQESPACFVLASKAQDERPSAWNLYKIPEQAEAGRARIPPGHSGGPDGYEAITWEAFLERQRQFYLRDPEETSLEYWTMHLEMLPPLKWEVADGVERFMCSEFLDGNFTRQHARFGDRYFTRIVDADDPSTWITAAMIGDLFNR